MASYSRFLGHQVTVQYRAGDILLPASGTFVGDSGRSIFLEQHVEQRGRVSYFRWEIPYRCINRLEEIAETESTSNAPAPEIANLQPRANAAAASQTGPSAPSLSPLPPHHPKSA
jgi:hypothetical protein